MTKSTFAKTKAQINRINIICSGVLVPSHMAGQIYVGTGYNQCPISKRPY